jgi:Ca2+-transporting ATPase
VPGRARFRIAALRGERRSLARLASRLLVEPGICTVGIGELTGSVLVRFVPPASVESLAEIVRRFIADGCPPPVRAARPRADSLSAAVSPSADWTTPWHAMPITEAILALETDRTSGLSRDEARGRLGRYGPNELPRLEPRSALAIFTEQFGSLPVLLLGGSAGVSLATGGIADAAVIMSVVLLNAAIATATERQAEHTILGMSRYVLRLIPVFRDGARHLVQPSELVPGDVVIVEPGTLVPADLRLLESLDLSVNESALTGESLPVHKDASATLAHDALLAERATMVYRGTAVTGGRGLGVVTATGPVTEVGKIQALLDALKPPETPMERQLGEVGRELVLINGAICAAVFGIGLLRGHPLLRMLKSAISLAVAAVPEGLPAVATTTLSLGIQEMRRRGVLVRRLDALETFAAVQVVGLDKTGTLTTNQMSVVAIHASGDWLEIGEGRLTCGAGAADPRAVAATRRALEIGSLCSEVELHDGPDRLLLAGSPTETALVRAALDLGIDVRDLRARHPIIRVVPRSETRKRMSTLHAARESRQLVAVKGDPVEVLGLCTRWRVGHRDAPLDERTRERIVQANERMAGRALRVLGFAEGKGARVDGERDLTWLGLIGMADPLRESAPSAIRQLHRAGVRTVMLTGDQSTTAFTIARRLDLGEGGDIHILEAGQFDALPADALAALAAKAHVFARVSPSNKLKIVRALQSNGEIVGMTGDGINDGPALRAANIGIAMGGAGSEVAREVADVVLAADNLDGLLDALRLGRATYANIRKVLRYLVGTNASETLVMLGAAIIGLRDPLTPMQLLWLNLVSDVLPALALGLEPPETDVLAERPRDPLAPILSVGDFRMILREGAVIGAGALLSHAFASGGAADNSATFNGLTLGQLVHAIACRSERHGIGSEFARPPNRKLYAALGICLAMQALAHGVPFTRRLLQLGPLTLGGLAEIATASLGPLVLNETVTSLSRRREALQYEPGVH